MSISIFNPKEYPYGPLSNNYYDELLIDKVKYKNVTSYIYSQLGCNNLYKQIIQQQKLRDIRDTAITLYGKCFNIVTSSVLEKALISKYSDPDLKRELLSTGDSFLVFEDPDAFLGNADGKGENQYGKVLMKVRNEMRVREGKIEKERIIQLEKDNIYKIYGVYEYLSNLMKNVKSDLSEFQGKTAYDIVNEVGLDKIVKDIGPKEEIFKLYTNNKLSEIIKLEYNSPGTIVEKIRNIYLPRFEKRLTYIVKEQVFDNYTSDLLARTYPEVKDISLAKKQQFNKLTNSELENLVNEVFDLYIQGKITVKETEDSLRLKEMIKPKERLKFSFAVSDNIIRFNSNNPVFSPISQYKLFSVNGLLYPTIFHVIVTSWISSLSIINSLTKAYSFILVNKEEAPTKTGDFYSWNQVFDIFGQVNNDNYFYIVTEACKKALNIKFKNPILKELLVYTGNARLIYNDKKDDILGVGKNEKGANIVGIELEKLRETFKFDGVAGSIEKINVQSIFNVLSKDEISEWVDMRIQDICRVIKVFSKYVSEKIDQVVKIDKEMCFFVINKLYKSCNLEVELDEAIPDSLLEKIKIQFLKTDIKVEFNENCVGVIATYITSLISNLNELAEERGLSPLEQLKETQDYFMKVPQECEGPYKESGEEINNFIFTGINFLLENFRLYFLGKNYNVDKVDLLACFNIIYPNGIDEKPKFKEPSLTLVSALQLPIEDLGLIQWFIDYMNGENDKNLKNRINRLVFFCNKVEKIEVPTIAWD